jgi:hypothetical protein
MSDRGTVTAHDRLNGHGREPNHSQSVNRSHIHRIDGPLSVAWREGTLTRAYELDALCEWLPLALAALKLPTGAITAFLGLLLVRGQFAQELFTHFVHQQGQTVINIVRAADAGRPATV